MSNKAYKKLISAALLLSAANCSTEHEFYTTYDYVYNITICKYSDDGYVLDMTQHSTEYPIPENYTECEEESDKNRTKDKGTNKVN